MCSEEAGNGSPFDELATVAIALLPELHFPLFVGNEVDVVQHQAKVLGFINWGFAAVRGREVGGEFSTAKIGLMEAAPALEAAIELRFVGGGRFVGMGPGLSGCLDDVADVFEAKRMALGAIVCDRIAMRWVPSFCRSHRLSALDLVSQDRDPLNRPEYGNRVDLPPELRFPEDCL